MADSPLPRVRKLAIEAIARSATLRATRTALAQMPAMAALPSPEGKKNRLVYDMKTQGSSFLPGKLVRSEGDPKTKDPAVNEAYDYAGVRYVIYRKLFTCNYLVDRSMNIVSRVQLDTC